MMVAVDRGSGHQHLFANPEPWLLRTHPTLHDPCLASFSNTLPQTPEAQANGLPAHMLLATC